ncbi:hypothetical protein D1872_72680 [compost metagenome]
MARKIWANHKPVGEVHTEPRKKIMVALVARAGVKSVLVQEWYATLADPDLWKPSPRFLDLPITIPLHGVVQTPAESLVELIDKALTLSDDFALDDPDNYVYRR